MKAVLRWFIFILNLQKSAIKRWGLNNWFQVSLRDCEVSNLSVHMLMPFKGKKNHKALWELRHMRGQHILDVVDLSLPPHPRPLMGWSVMVVDVFFCSS